MLLIKCFSKPVNYLCQFICRLQSLLYNLSIGLNRLLRFGFATCRYTHKVAINNHRLLKLDETDVRFHWRDYRDNKVKIMTLEGAEFLRRFCQHILPRAFVRIRHYGLLSTTRRTQLRELQQAFGIHVPKIKEKKHWKDISREHLNFNPDICPTCGKGHMVTVEIFLSPRPPPLSRAILSQSFAKS